MLSLDLTEMETERLVNVITKSVQDAEYYSQYFEEKYSRSLMDKIVNALLKQQNADEFLDSSSDNHHMGSYIGYKIFDPDYFED